jgi:hypothetical protein
MDVTRYSSGCISASIACIGGHLKGRASLVCGVDLSREYLLTSSGEMLVDSNGEKLFLKK